MRFRYCKHYRPAQPDIIRRLQDYARGYTDRQAERRS
jgi:hypothetical protein